jgi:hypothetical protein
MQYFCKKNLDFFKNIKSYDPNIKFVGLTIDIAAWWSMSGNHTCPCCGKKREDWKKIKNFKSSNKFITDQLCGDHFIFCLLHAKQRLCEFFLLLLSQLNISSVTLVDVSRRKNLITQFIHKLGI